MVTLCFASFSAASGEAVLYQTPAYIAASLGESISITCRANQSISDYLSWYKQKPGQAPMILIYDADNRYNGVPERFTATQSETEFVFTISQVEADDAAMYYCQQDYALPPTVLQPQTWTILPGQLCAEGWWLQQLHCAVCSVQSCRVYFEEGFAGWKDNPCQGLQSFESFLSGQHKTLQPLFNLF